MNKKQYNNVIENTLKHELSAQTDDSLATARAIFDNMGVALPQGDMKTVYETIKTDNYMGWKSCTMQEAQAAADNGTAAIGISEDKIVVISANDEEQPVAQTASVMSLDENTSAYAVAGLEYYSYGYGTTNYNPLYFSNSNLNVNVGWTGYNTLYGASSSTVYWTTSNPNIMKVDYYSGHLQAVGVGSAWITATTSNGFSAEFYVQVEKLRKYVTVEEIVRAEALIDDALGNDAMISYQQYNVLVRLFYTISRIENNNVFVDEISVFTKYDKGVIPFGVNYPDISIGALTIGGNTYIMQNDTSDYIGDPNWVIDRKVLSINRFLPLNTNVSTMAQLMLDAAIYPLRTVEISTNLSL